MVVIKILEGVLQAGASSISFTNSDIPYSVISSYCSKDGMYPIREEVSGSTITLYYQPQSTNTNVALKLVKGNLEIIDALTDTSTDKALSANQGKALKDLIDAIPEGKTNLSEMNDVAITDIEDGQVLAWDSVSEKFKNVNQSGGSSSLKYPMDDDEHELEPGIYVKRFVGSNAGTNLVLMSNLTGHLLDCYGYVRSSLGGYTNQYYTFCSFVNNDWRAFIYQNGSNIIMSNGNYLLGEYMVWCVYTK